MTAALGADLAVEFGLDAAGPDDPTFTWTERGQVKVSDGVDLVRGRTPGDSSITAGSAGFTVIDLEGDLFANVTTGTPVRIRATVTDDGTSPLYGLALFGLDLYGVGSGGTATGTVWRGVVEGRPRAIEGGVLPVIDIEALDVAGLAAQTDGPTSAFEAAVADLAQQPDGWWRACADGWIDKVTDATARHTSALTEVEPLVAGGDVAFASASPGEGVGVAESGGRVVVGNDGEPFMVAMWVRFDNEVPQSQRYVFNQVSATSGVNLSLLVDPDGFASITMASPTEGRYFWITNPAGVLSTFNINDGRPHLIVLDGGHNVTVDGGSVTRLLRLWVDGRQLTLVRQFGLGSGGDADPGTFYLGADSSGRTTAPMTGALDHFIVWNDHPFIDDMATVVADLTAAGRVAWAGDRLDERIERITDAANLSTLTGTLDASGIATGVGYVGGSNTLSLLQQVEDTEQGRVWVDREGMLRFSRRSWAWTDTTATTVQAWFSDDADDVSGDALPMLVDRLVIHDADPRVITTSAEVTAENGRTQFADSPTAITAYGRRNPVSLSGLLHASDQESLAIAQWQVASRSVPQARIESLAFDLTDPRCAALLLTIEDGHLIKVTSRGVDHLAHVVGITHRIRDTWVVTLNLDGTRANRTFFRADISIADGDDKASF